MATLEMVRDIIGTYDLPARTAQSLTNTAVLRTTELGLDDLSRTYRWVGHLVEKSAVPWWERGALRLDGVLISSKGSYMSPLGELIGSEAPQESIGVERWEIRPMDAIHLLRGRVSDQNLDLLQRWLESANASFLLSSSPDELVAAAPQIEDRINVLKNIYGRSGDFYVSPPATRARSYTVSIEFRNQARIRRVSLEERFDGFMEDRRYALVRYGKTGRKPEVYHHSIVALYGPTKGNASDAARRLGCNRSTIRDHWRKQGLTPKGRKLSKEISLLRARHAALETIR